MRNLAPNLFRQRLLIEGLFDGSYDETAIAGYFDVMTKALGLKMYASPMIYSPGDIGRPENQGYDAFVPLVDSGISISIWNSAKLVSVFIHSCKQFKEARAIEITKEYFNIRTIEAEAF